MSSTTTVKRGGAKQPAPLSVPAVVGNKKGRKKKDPNEPQKPVSAYALFFRDTQAAIKGQNPSASFGEVSKIVASMWDSLAEEQKQVFVPMCYELFVDGSSFFSLPSAFFGLSCPGL